MRSTTPLRQADSPPVAVRPHPAAPDDLVARLHEVLDSTEDHSSWSDELAALVRSPADEPHLSPQQPNVLRGLRLPTGGAVLHVGAGSGGVTRYLGENADLVDALEADPALAALAARRCIDLPAVEVHQVDLDDVPSHSAYDLIVAMDLPASTDPTTLLARCRDLLRPGGLIVIAVDATRVVGGGPGPSLRLTRAEVTHALGSTGLGGLVLGAFPHHRLATALIDHGPLRRLAPSLLLDLVRLPSDGSTSDGAEPTVSTTDWADHVASGDDADHPGSFVVLAGDAVPEVGPAVFWSSHRRAEVSACNRVQSSPEGPVVVRADAFPAAAAAGGPLRLVPHTEPYVPGIALTRLLSRSDSLVEVRSALSTWRRLVADTRLTDGTVPWDLIPRNVQVTTDGSLRPIDQEWARTGCDESMVLHRGTFWLSHDLLTGRATPWWLTGHTIASGADLLMALAGAPIPADWRPVLIEPEAVSMAWVNPLRPLDSITTRIIKEWHNVSDLGREPHDAGELTPPADDTPPTAAALQEMLVAVSRVNADLRERVEQLELARREEELAQRDHAIGLRAKIEAARAEADRARADARRQRRAAQTAHEELAAVRESMTWRLGRAVVTPAVALRKRTRR